MKVEANMRSEHEVVTGSTKPPGQGGWIFYYCVTCGVNQSWLCANKYADDPDAWGEAVARFNTNHPHKEAQESRWT
jgi:hypothetical protein